MAEAAEYIAQGWALCQFDKGTKGGGAREWNARARAITDPAKLRVGQNIGLLHAWSRTCALDVDKYPEAREWLGERGIELDALLAADDAVQICSGREGRAKLLFRLPDGVDPLSLITVQIKDPLADASRRDAMWLELRCSAKGGVSVQDVLPPSIHPDTGNPYTWGGTGDWRNLPEVPAALFDLWRSHVPEPDLARRKRGATGPGTSAATLDFVRRLQQAGCKPYRAGPSFRAHCPVHGGASGTTLKVDEAGTGEVLFHCHADCQPEAILAALPPRDAGVPSISSFHQLKAANDARKAAREAPTPARVLPAFPAELLDLPYGLGELQRWILGYMTHPSPACAGLTALATLSHFAMTHIGIDSRDGLGLNEQYLLLAPTGFGKEDLRKPIAKITEAVRALPAPAAGGGNLWQTLLPRVQFSAPASQQGLHKLLEEHSAQTFLADEFAEWLGHAANDGHKQQALGHIMQAYSKAFGTLAAPHAITSKLRPVDRPRVLIFATSTAERILETINTSQADSGALNRFVILIAEQERIAKRYDVAKADYVPPPPIVDLAAWVASRPDKTLVSLDDDARGLYIAHDSAVIDPLGYSDPRLAKRVGEQAFKFAALIALSDRRTVIDARDLAIAYAIREGLYHRAASLIRHDGALSGSHKTGRALEQLRQILSQEDFIFRSNLPKRSRQFAGLAIGEQEAVIRALQTNGFARLEGARLVSLIKEAA